VLLGNGDGSFQAATSFAVVNYARSVAVADLDGDSVLDLVTANLDSGDVSVLLGNGDGTFQAAATLPVAAHPSSVAVADLDGDSILDLVTADGSYGNVSVLLGNGDGTFQAATAFAAGGDSPVSVAVADFDGDSVLDLVTANRFSNDVSVLLGLGASEPDSPDIDVAPLAVDFGDVALPGSNMLIVTLSNLGTLDLTIDGVGFESGSNTAFSIDSAPSVPAVLSPEATVDVVLTFTPTALGVVAAGLEILSDDPDEASVVVDLTGAGVASEAPPAEQVATTLEFIEDSVLAGTLEGEGSGGSASGRLNALINQIEAAGDLITAGQVAEGCDQLLDALRRTDGESPPPDFVTGEAASQLALLIEITRDELGCQ
jgi:hypothetical protein